MRRGGTFKPQSLNSQGGAAEEGETSGKEKVVFHWVPQSCCDKFGFSSTSASVSLNHPALGNLGGNTGPADNLQATGRRQTTTKKK